MQDGRTMKILTPLVLSMLLCACAGTQPHSADYIRTANQIPPDIVARLREIGPVSAPEPTRPLYAPLQPAEPFANVAIKRDLRYGPGDRHRLDVFTPAGASARPVLLFMHGGAYVGGDKHLAGSPFYTNIGAWAARNGMVGVNMTYRLAPQAKWPAAQQDIGSAIAWVRANAAAHGGDPNRIYLMGHSAGASHVSNYLAHSQFHTAGGPGVAGAIIVSAFYDFEALNATQTFFQYHGNDKAQYVQRSPLPGLVASRVPMLFAVAQYDTPDFVQQAELLRQGFCRAGRCQRVVMLTNHSHMSEIYSVNTADTGLTSEMLAFIKP
jgi:acetyl esterase/lipase